MAGERCASAGRRGVALAAAVFALAVTGLLSAALFLAARQESLLGENAVAAQRAAGAAQFGLGSALSTWGPDENGLRPGRERTLRGEVRAASFEVRVRRLSARNFLLESTGRDVAGRAERVDGLIVRLDPPVLATRAALSLRSVPHHAPAEVSGDEVNPDGWDCPGSREGAQAVATVPGEPDSSFFMRDGWDWRRLVAWASARAIAESVSVRYEPSSARVNGGRYLGVLVAGGDLVLDGGAEVVGLVVARGEVAFEGEGASVVGAVVADRLRSPGGAMRIARSSCAMNVVLGALAPARPLRSRPWVSLR